ncbi:MAG: hypothetical protein U0452_05680 [Anaerolineae bacterium]
MKASTMAHKRRLRRKTWQSDRSPVQSSNHAEPSHAPSESAQVAPLGDLTHPQALTSNQLVHLQRVMGNQGVMRLLASNGQAVSPSGRTSIQRYPADVLDVPLKKKKWKKYTGSVEKSAEGVSGGVTFYRSRPGKGPVETVVVKPEHRSYGPDVNSETGKFAENKLREAGFAVPKSRRVDSRQPEGQEIVDVMEKFGVPFTYQHGELSYDEIGVLQLMDVASGESLAKYLKKGADPGQEGEKVDKTMELFSSSNFKGQLAKLIATDIVLGNDDRISHYVQNFGNLMITGTNIVPIDSDSDLTPNFGVAGRREALQKLAQRPEEIADNFLNGVDIYLRLTSDATADLFRQHHMYRMVREALIRALKDASYVVAARSNKIASGEHAELIRQRQEQLMEYLRG